MKRTAKKPLQTAVVLAALILALFLWWNGPNPFRSIAPGASLDFGKLADNKPLMDAIDKGDYRKTKALLDAGASPNSRTVTDKDGEGYTAISAAASDGRLDIVRLLVDHGASINAPDFWGGNALMSAALNAHPDVVRYLIGHGADVNAEDDSVTTLDYLTGGSFTGQTPDEKKRYREVLSEVQAAGARHGVLYSIPAECAYYAAVGVLGICLLFELTKFLRALKSRAAA